VLPEVRSIHSDANQAALLPFDHLRADLLTTWNSEGSIEESVVTALENRWPAITEPVFRKAAAYDELLTKLQARLGEETDPAALAVHLLGASGASRKEVLHTQILGRLLDPGQAGALGVRLLHALLGLVGTNISDDDLAKAKVKIEPVYTTGPDNDTLRPDLRITIPRNEETLTVILENKIDTVDHDGQLDGYVECLRKIPEAEKLFVYLTPTGAPPVLAEQKAPWRCLSYREIAIEWRRVLARSGDESGGWRDILRLYLGTVVQEIWGVWLPAGEDRGMKARLIPYLRAALGES
jgi:hypothetical protein